jgi:hypothetical protein
MIKSLVCNIATYSGIAFYFRVYVSEMYFKKFNKDSVQFPSQKKLNSKLPFGRPSHLFGRPSVSTVQACIRPDI